MKLDELIKQLKEQQDAGYGDYNVIVFCYSDSYDVKDVGMDHELKEVIL